MIGETDGFYLMHADTFSKWVHAVVVYHGVEQGMTVYFDGNKLATVTAKVRVPTATGNGTVFIGKDHYLEARYATASVDEIKMYNRQLSQEEISNMY